MKKALILRAFKVLIGAREGTRTPMELTARS